MSNLMNIAGQAEENLSKEVYNLFDEEYKKGVEHLFEELHSAELNGQPYKKENYKRVAFERGEQAEAFVAYMKRYNIEDTVAAPMKLNGQWLVEIPQHVKLKDIQDTTGANDGDDILLQLKEKKEQSGATAVSANELISAYHGATGEYTEQVKSTDNAKDIYQNDFMEQSIGEEVSGYLINQMEGVNEVYGIYRKAKDILDIFTLNDERKAENDPFLSKESVRSKLGLLDEREVRNEQYNPHVHHGNKDKAIVLRGSIVVINGCVVTDRELRDEILKQHAERTKRAEHLAKGAANMNQYGYAAQERRRVENNANIIQSQIYQQEYTVHTSVRKEGKLFKGGVLDSITNGYNTADIVRNMQSTYQLKTSFGSALDRVDEITKGKNFTEQQEELLHTIRSKVRLAKTSEVEVTLSVDERKALDEMFSRTRYSVYTVRGSEEKAIEMLTYTMASGNDLQKSLSRLNENERKRIAESLERFSKAKNLSSATNALNTAEKAVILKFVTNPNAVFTEAEQKSLQSAMAKQNAEHTANKDFQNQLGSLQKMMKFDDEETLLMQFSGMETMLKQVIAYDKAQNAYDADYVGMEIGDITSGHLKQYTPADVSAMGISEKEWQSLESFMQNKESMMANFENLKALEKDFGIKISADAPLTRERILEVNQAFIKKAEHTKSGKSYQFVTRNAVTGKYEFDLEALKNLTDEELKDIGISKESRDMLVKINDDSQWGFNLKQFSASTFQTFSKVFCKLTKDDAEMQQTMQDFRMMKKTYQYTKKSAAAVHRTTKAVKLRVDTFRMSRANGASGTQAFSNAFLSKTQKTPEVGNAAEVRDLNTRYNERYVRQQEKKLQRIERDENSVINKGGRWLENKVNAARMRMRENAEKAERFAASMLSKTKSGQKVLEAGRKVKAAAQTAKAANEAIAAAKAAAGKYVAIGAVFLLLICLLEMIFLVILMSIVNLTEADYTEKAAFVLYEVMKDKEDEWIDNLSNNTLTFNNRKDGSYGNLSIQSYSSYVDSVENLLLGSGGNEDELYINPFVHENNIVTVDNANKDLLTEIKKYDGKTSIGLSVNTNISSQRTEEENFDSGKSSIESGHTCNIKDILAMIDVMYQMNTGGVTDAMMESVLGMKPSTLNWINGAENVITAFKWGKAKVKSWFGSEEEDPLAEMSLSDALDSDGVVSYKAVENYAISLWESSHQEKSYYETNFYTVLRDAETKLPTNKYTMRNNGEVKEITLKQKEASELNLCVEPVKKQIPVLWKDNNPAPYIKGEDGTNYVLNDDPETSGFSVKIECPANLAEGEEENICLWAGMDSNEETYNKIKANSEGEKKCWEKGETETTDITESFESNGWNDSSESARREVNDKILAYKNEYAANHPPVYLLGENEGEQNSRFEYTHTEIFEQEFHDYSDFMRVDEQEVVISSEQDGWDYYDDIVGYLGWFDSDEYSPEQVNSSADMVTLSPHMIEEKKTQYHASVTALIGTEYKETYTRHCKKHDFEYCGGHVRLHNQGVVFSATNEQMAMTGIAEPSPVAVNTKTAGGDDVAPYDLGEAGYDTIRGKYILEDIDEPEEETNADDEPLGISFAEYTSGGRNKVEDVTHDIQGSYITHGQGLNLWGTDDGGDWRSASATNGISLLDTTQSYWARDIFDIDCMLLKAKGVFPLRKFDDYEGWNAENMQLVLMKLSTDWTDIYGFNVPLEVGDKWDKEQSDRTEEGISTSGYTLNTSDIETITKLIETQYEGISDRRKKAVELTLQWVGKGHYSEVHTTHDFLSATCNSNLHVAESPEDIDDSDVDYSKLKGSCTASDNFGFINYIYNSATDFKENFDFRPENYYDVLYSDRNSWKNEDGSETSAVSSLAIESNGMASAAKPADLLVKKRVIQAENLDIGDVNWTRDDEESDIAREVMMRYEMPEAVIFIGTFSSETLQTVDEDYNGEYITLSSGQKIYADVPVTVDLTSIHNIGNIYLHTLSPTDIMDLNGDTNYLWVMPTKQGYYNVHCYSTALLDTPIEEPTEDGTEETTE